MLLFQKLLGLNVQVFFSAVFLMCAPLAVSYVNPSELGEQCKTGTSLVSILGQHNNSWWQKWKGNLCKNHKS